MAAEPSEVRSTAAPSTPVGRQMRVPKMAELVAGHLRRQIVRGELTEGEALPSEAALMEQFQVSRPTLREAFRVLESESLISVRRGAHGGARVQLPDADVAARYAGLVLEHRGTTLEDVYEARIVIEPPSVALLAGRRSAADLDRLRAALAEHEAVIEDSARSVRAHTTFHHLLTELTGNQTLTVLVGMLEHLIDLATLSHVESDRAAPAFDRASRKGLAAHRRVVDLIEAKDAAGAEQLWRKHLTEARDYLLRADVKTVLDLLG
ncbi:FadR/GntR family transcriptional regulator [Pseudonocardia bannensis]|nr:FCD domain-containing protein [Pseudonocardia bannensis]